MLINQGFEPDLVAHLLIARADVYLMDLATKSKVGEAIASYRNDHGDRRRFGMLVDCNTLDVREVSTPPTKLIPISRLALHDPTAKDGLTLEQFALFEGDKFALSDKEGISANGKTDDQVFIVKPGSKSRMPKLVSHVCRWTKDDLLAANTAEAAYIKDGIAQFGSEEKQVVLELVFRSPEAVLRAVGDMVRLAAPDIGICNGGGSNCLPKDQVRQPIFQVSKDSSRTALINTRFMDENYSIPSTGYRSMQVISIIQQLVNLQKESSERALSIPVRAVP